MAQDDSPTYSELGIDYKDASRLQRAAEHSEAIAEKIAEVKAKGQPVMANRIINQVLQDVQKEVSTLPLPYAITGLKRAYRASVIGAMFMLTIRFMYNRVITAISSVINQRTSVTVTSRLQAIVR